MADPWLHIIGLNEDGLAGLSSNARSALGAAEVIFGGPRHLELADAGPRGQAWPIPFSVDPVMALRGQKVVILASGDPFWFGAGGSITPHLTSDEWRAFPSPSTFALAVNHLGWRLEETHCFGLHAAPFSQLLGHLHKDAQLICLLRNGTAPAELAAWLVAQGAEKTEMFIMERLGGPNQRVRHTRANAFDLTDVQAPVAVALHIAQNAGRANAPGLPDDSFAHDGQITKQPIRTLTIAALAPRKAALLWDIGAGSGSVSVEWCLAGGRAVAMEAKPQRCANIATNITRFGLAQQMTLVEGKVDPTRLHDLPQPDAVFIGGGANEALVKALCDLLPQGTRLVINGVTLETEMLLAQWHARKGGSLLRIELASAAPLGTMRGWQPARPVVQWSVAL
ncbi:precorrin-6y C5,15-methyltransferase (decarboxylating) subunit CbiE [Pseudorhodobacter sp. W20_MBD10_FR17]|uniref:precorrin-6y C5,15-methyltransferase (decarboxylating) subunit CbiE n=1 Tax=Pseudorhodobacter sp. W20_MBD10_FR17 TaxID=3240266 RepID=UPI003F99C3CE